jgi:hypothetical protein
MPSTASVMMAMLFAMPATASAVLGALVVFPTRISMFGPEMVEFPSMIITWMTAVIIPVMMDTAKWMSSYSIRNITIWSYQPGSVIIWRRIPNVASIEIIPVPEIEKIVWYADSYVKSKLGWSYELRRLVDHDRRLHIWRRGGRPRIDTYTNSYVSGIHICNWNGECRDNAQ